MAKDLDQKLSDIQDKVEEVSNTINKIDKDLAVHKVTFISHLEQDERMYEEFKRMNDILQQNTESLKEHMHRTELLEHIVQKMDIRLSPLEIQRLENDIITKYRNEKLKKIGKIIGIVTTLIGLGAALKPLLAALLNL